MVALDVDAVSRMAPGRFYRDHEGAVNALDFHHTEDALVTTGDDDAIHLYNTNTGTKTKTLYSKKYGCTNVCFTHSAAAVIYSSRSKGGAGESAIDDHAVRYHSLHDNTYLRYFKGHTDAVTSISMCATNDNFLTASADRTVRLWDLRTPKCVAAIHECPAIPYVAYDAQGEVFAVTEGNGIVKLFPVSGYERGSFAQFDAFHDNAGNYVFNPNEPPPAISCVKFSPDGKKLLIVSGNFITILDAFSGEHTMRIRVPGSGQQQHAVTPMEASWSPDGEFVVSGGADSRIHVWSANTGFAVSQWRARHAGLPTAVKWAPNMMLVASGCTEGGTALWVEERRR
jgi:COMPASS component SWD2